MSKAIRLSLWGRILGSRDAAGHQVIRDKEKITGEDMLLH